MKIEDLRHLNLFVVSKHGKEKLITPSFLEAIKPKSIQLVNFDTDKLGTFSGEIERKLNPHENVLEKLKLGYKEQKTEGLYLASEGSFGSHPFVPFSLINEEFVGVYAPAFDFFHVCKTYSSITNYNKKSIRSKDKLELFLTEINFPEQRIIVSINNEVHKNIIDFENLLKLLLANEFKSCFIEVDLRAMNNLPRQKVIIKAIDKLQAELRSSCPSCELPGFVVNELEEGLPCAQCCIATKGIKFFISKCQKCEYIKKEKNQKSFEDPQFCNICNP